MRACECSLAENLYVFMWGQGAEAVCNAGESPHSLAGPTGKQSDSWEEESGEAIPAFPLCPISLYACVHPQPK